MYPLPFLQWEHGISSFSHRQTLYRVPSNMPSLSLAALLSHKSLSFLFRFKVPSRLTLIPPPCPCVLAPLISYGLFPQYCTLGTTNGELSPTAKALAFSSCSVSQQFIGDSEALGRCCPNSVLASDNNPQGLTQPWVLTQVCLVACQYFRWCLP